MTTLRTTVAPEAAAPLETDGWSAEVRRDDAGLANLRTEWDDLSGRCAAATPFQSHAWLESWWRHYGRPGRLRVVLVRHGGPAGGSGRVACFAAAGLRGARTRSAGRCRTSPTSSSTTRSPVAAARALATTLLGCRGWQVIDFAGDAARAAAGTALRRRLARPDRWQYPASLCLELPATWSSSSSSRTCRRTPARRCAPGQPDREAGPRRARAVDRRRRDRRRRRPAAPAPGAVAGPWVNPEHLRPEFAAHLASAVRGMIADGAGRAAGVPRSTANWWRRTW